MRFSTKQIEIRNGTLVIPIPREEIYQANDLLQDIKSGRELTVEILQKRQKRSLDANAYFWGILTEMAAVLRTTKDELYREMLIRYGTVLTHIIVKPEAMEKFINKWHGAARVLGEVEVNGKKGMQLQVYAGSSTYDSLQFSRLLDGAIEDARSLGLNYPLDEEERKKMIDEWNQK